MIPTIGIMVGAYIFTRMLEIILKKETHGAVAIAAGITMLIVGLSVFDLITSSLNSNKELISFSNIPGSTHH